MDSANACGVLGRGIEALRARFLEDAEPVVIVFDYNVIARSLFGSSFRASINQANLLKGTGVLDKSMDKQLKKYIENILTCAKYVGEERKCVIHCYKKIKIRRNFIKTKMIIIYNTIHNFLCVIWYDSLFISFALILNFYSFN